MKKLWLILAISGLILIILPNLFLFKGMITPSENYALMGFGLLLFFVGRMFYGRQ
jgi:hypothetical protein